MTKMISKLILALTFSILLTTAAPAMAITFGPATNVSNDVNTSLFSSIATDGANVYAVWSDNNSSILFSHSNNGGATFSAPLTISTNADSGIPSIATDGTNIYVAWNDDITGSSDILFSHSPVSSIAFSAPVTIHSNSGFGTASIATDGVNVYVVWNDNFSGISNILFSQSLINGPPFSPTFTPVAPISSFLSNSFNPSVTTDGTNIYVAWSDDFFGNFDIFFSQGAITTSVFSLPVNISNSPGISFGSSVTTDGTNVYVAWHDNTPGNFDIFFSQSAIGAPSFIPAPTPITINTPFSNSNNPSVTTDGTNIYVAWVDFASGIDRVLFSEKSVSANVFDPITLVSNDALGTDTPGISIDGANIFATWVDNAPGNFDIFVTNATLSNNGCWSTNPNMQVSTENIATSNVFGGPMVTKVTICDSDIMDIFNGVGEPDVTVNGKILRMVQDNTGLWHGYFADKTQAQLADQSANISSPPGVDLDFGYFCSNQSIVPAPISFLDTVGITLPVNTTISGSQGTTPFPTCSGVATSPNHNNVISGIDTLNTIIPSIGQIGINNIQFWPFIQLYDFVENGTAVVQYNKGGGVQSATLTFDSSDLSVDSDGDGIADVIDLVPTNPSFAFSDIPLGFTTFGSIITSGDQTLTILDVPAINGVKISASSHGGPIPATVSDCNGTIYTLTAGDVIVIACASSDTQVLKGITEVEYFVNGVSFGTTTLNAGDDVTFEQDTLTFTNNGSTPVVILVNGEQITIDGGETVALPGDVTLCHKDKKTITISSEDVDDHLRHGDELGACEDEEHEDKKGNGHDKHEDKEKGKGHEKFDDEENEDDDD